MRVLGIIPARGGSKGIPRKNIRPLCGKPLIAYTIESAEAARLLTRTVLSTEDEEIAELGRNLGVDVPFMRPRELAEDASPTLPVVQHALAVLERSGERYDAVCLLQPTNPLRRGVDIDNCIELLDSTGADSVISVSPVPDSYNPHWVYWKTEGGRLAIATGEDSPIPRRQELPPAYHREGSVYVTRTDVVRDQKSLYGKTTLAYEIPPEFSSNIDVPSDWQEIEARMSGNINKRPK